MRRSPKEALRAGGPGEQSINVVRNERTEIKRAESGAKNKETNKRLELSGTAVSFKSTLLMYKAKVSKIQG